MGTRLAWQRNIGSYTKKITPILMVKNLDFNCVRNFSQKAIVYMISLIYICFDFYKKYIFHKP